MAHTPAPWTVYPDPSNNIHNVKQVFIVPAAPGKTIASCVAHGVSAEADRDLDQRAALIAAAPELLAALAQFVAAYDEEPTRNQIAKRIWDNQLFDVARAAIAKAGGAA